MVCTTANSVIAWFGVELAKCLPYSSSTCCSGVGWSDCCRLTKYATTIANRRRTRRVRQPFFMSVSVRLVCFQYHAKCAHDIPAPTLIPETIHQSGGYCWSTSKCRNWRAQHTFFEGKKAQKTFTRKST